MSGSIWGMNNRCGCGINTCCRSDGICCKRERCRKRCCPKKESRVNVTDNNIVFYTTDIVGAWQGIRWMKHNGSYILAGTSGSSGIIYLGPINALSVSIYPVNFPNATATSAYGPDVPNINESPIRVVGTYRNNSEVVFGFLFRGTVEELTDSSRFRSIQIGPTYTFAHSVMGDIIVGTNDNASQHNTFNLPLGPINAFVYNIQTGNTDKVHFPGSVSNAAYGVWHNGGSSYTICGGYSFSAIEITSVYVSRNGVALPLPFGHAFLVDYDSRERCFKNWTTFNYPESNIVTHFQGISAVSNRRNSYQLAAVSAPITSTNVTQGSWVEVKRKQDRCSKRDQFQLKRWINVDFPNSGLNAVNSVAGNNIVGHAEENNNNIIPYQAQLLIDGFDLTF